MSPRAYQRARRLFDLAPCAPVFVRERVTAILSNSVLPLALHDELHALLPAWGAPPGRCACRFPVLAAGGQEPGFDGGLLTLVSTGAEVGPPRGAQRAVDHLDLGPLPDTAGNLSVTGLPGRGDPLLVGRSGSAAAWLAIRARLTGRPIPPDVVVSADLLAGADGVARLAPVAGGAAKARIVARELPGARFLLCGDAGGHDVESLPVNAGVDELERAVWGAVAVVSAEELARVSKDAGDAFRRHDYAGAGALYRAVTDAEGAGDPELLFEACLRLAAIEVHAGRPAEADLWFARADGVKVPRTWKAAYLVERVAGMAGQAVDTFHPMKARELLQHREARRAADAEHTNEWERIQVLGAWRRLHLLEGNPFAARDAQRALLDLTDALERHRARLDLGFVEIRCGDLDAAGDALTRAHLEIEDAPSVYRVQSRAFLAWHAARLALCGTLPAGLAAVLEPDALASLVDQAQLQAAGRWRVRAVVAARAGDHDALLRLSAELTPFQRWYLGVFLLDGPATCTVAARILHEVEVDLTETPALRAAQQLLRGGRLEPEAFRLYAAY